MLVENLQNSQKESIEKAKINESLLRQILCHVKTNKGIDLKDLPDEIARKLPLQSVEDLENLEVFLSDDQNFILLVNLQNYLIAMHNYY